MRRETIFRAKAVTSRIAHYLHLMRMFELSHQLWQLCQAANVPRSI